jgi:hypothetical protein
MIDPRKAIEDLRRSQFRVDVLDLLINIANAQDESVRRQVDAKIWDILARHGVARDAKEEAFCQAYCEHGSEFDKYSALIEARLASIPN